MYILSLYFGKKRILEAKTRCTVKELRSGGVEWETGGSNRMSGNERFRNQFSRYASSGDGRPRDETDTFVSRRAAYSLPWIMEDVLSKFLKCTTIAYWLPRKGGYNIYTRLLSTNQLFQHWHFGMAIYELSSRSFHAFVFSIEEKMDRFARKFWWRKGNRFLSIYMDNLNKSDIFTRDTSLFHSSKHWSKFFNL